MAQTKRTVPLGSALVEYALRRTPRARRLSLRVDARSGLTVVLPKQVLVETRHIESLIRAKSRWILRHLDRIESQKELHPLLRATAGSRLPFMGEEYTLVIEQTERRRASVLMTETEIVLRAPKEHAISLKTVLERWYRAQAAVAIPGRATGLAERFGMTYAKVVVRNQRTRWGSCSRRGTLSFNWRLVLLPLSVMDYLIVHELTHLKEMNHSPRFWSVVASMDPAYQDAERWLRRHGIIVGF